MDSLQVTPSVTVLDVDLAQEKSIVFPLYICLRCRANVRLGILCPEVLLVSWAVAIAARKQGLIANNLREAVQFVVRCLFVNRTDFASRAFRPSGVVDRGAPAQSESGEQR